MPPKPVVSGLLNMFVPVFAPKPVVPAGWPNTLEVPAVLVGLLPNVPPPPNVDVDAPPNAPKPVDGLDPPKSGLEGFVCVLGVPNAPCG